MGGKPFQSKGCKTCKKRKIKCDTQRPECGNCLKRGVPCLGYEKQFSFIYQTQYDQQSQEQKPRDRRSTGQVALRSPMVMDTASSNRAQIVASYINIYFPEDIRGSTELDPWFTLISGISAIPNKSIMLEKAMAATSCIYLGKANHDTRMLNHGLQLYNGAIFHVSQQLRRNNYSDELFFTISIFQILVSIYCPSLETSVHQVAVTNGILKQCVNNASDNPIIKALCVAFHRMRLLKALSPMEAQSVTEVATEHTPDAVISNENHPADELFELMAGISPLAAAVSMIDVSDNEACHSSLYNCLAHREKLLSWYAREINGLGGRPYIGQIGEFPSKDIPPSEHLFGHSYGFFSLDNARIHVLLWAALSILQAIIGQTYAYAYTSAPVDVENNKEYRLSEFYADEVSRAMPYCLQDSMRAWGVSGTIFGMMQIAQVYMELRNEEKFMWAQSLFKHVGDNGADLAYRMNEFFTYGWALMEKADREKRSELSPVPSSAVSDSTTSPISTASPTSPISTTSPLSSVSTATTAPFVEKYVDMQQEATDMPVRPRSDSEW